MRVVKRTIPWFALMLPFMLVALAVVRERQFERLLWVLANQLRF